MSFKIGNKIQLTSLLAGLLVGFLLFLGTIIYKMKNTVYHQCLDDLTSKIIESKLTLSEQLRFAEAAQSSCSIKSNEYVFHFKFIRSSIF